VLAVSLALLVVTGSIIGFGKYTLDNYFAQQRQSTQQYYRQAIAGILQQSRADISSISHLLPAFLGNAVDQRSRRAAIQTLMDDFWFNLELDSGIGSASLYTDKGELLAHWGQPLMETFPVASLIGYVTTHEAAMDTIQCSDDCVQYHGIPFLHAGQFSGVFIFGVPLTNLVLQFKAITGANVGILVSQDGVRQDILGNLLPWGKRVVALTEFDDNYSLLKDFAAAQPQGVSVVGSVFRHGGRAFEIILMPLEHLPVTRTARTASLIIIDDISDQLSYIRTATSLYVVNGLLSLLLTGGILLVLLLRPTRHLHALISVLPLLANKNYLEVTRTLPNQRKITFWRDEIDVLDETTRSLVLTLKQLDQEVEDRTQGLAERSNDLLQERNFVTSILDGAQVIIMTLDYDGRIVMSNHFTEIITGYSEEELKGRPFATFLAPEVPENLIDNSLIELKSLKRNTFLHECIFFAKQGQELYISWFHSRLEPPGREGPRILTVGLNLTERRKAEKQLAWLADHDPLTNLYNRRRFEKEFERLLALNQRYHQTGALLFFDIDQFKLINDSNGHKAGDELLVKLAERLRLVTRSTDIIARLGGDEFAVVVPQVEREQAEKVAQKIYDEMTSLRFQLDKDTYKISISAGLLLFPVPDCSVQDLLVSADLAMYKAKETGRGGWCLATGADGSVEEVRKRIDWKSRIEKALEEGYLVLFYQPIMRVKDRSICHYECLLRMRDDQGNMISPGFFLGIAQQMGLVTRIDQAVLQLAVKKQAEIIREGFDAVFSVNLSGEMISNPRLIPILTTLLAEHQVPASKFIFEVTETKVIENLEVARHVIENLKKLGTQFALDDFGVGFSSMNYLKQLPVDYIKIDGSFVRHMADDPEDSLFVQAIQRVANGLGKMTIAEFVETEETLALLEETGVDYVQGYAIGLPMPQLAFHSAPVPHDGAKTLIDQKVYESWTA